MSVSKTLDMGSNPILNSITLFDGCNSSEKLHAQFRPQHPAAHGVLRLSR